MGFFTVFVCVYVCGLPKKIQLNLRSFQIYTCRIHLCCFLWGLVCVSVWSCFPNQQINYRYMALGATFWQNQINIILNIKAFIQINLKFLKIVLLNMCSEYVLNMLWKWEDIVINSNNKDRKLKSCIKMWFSLCNARPNILS